MEPRAPSVADIQLAVCAARGISLEDLKGPSKRRRVAYPRQEAMALARRLTRKSYPDLGRLFGRAHTTVLDACRRVATREQENPSLRSTLSQIASFAPRARELCAAQAVGRLARTLAPLPAGAPPAETAPADEETALRQAWNRQAAKTPSHLSSI